VAGLRIVFITFVAPIAQRFVAALEELGHEPVAVLGARRSTDRPGPIADIELTDETVPKHVDLLLPRDKWSLEPLLRAYEPDVALCYGYPWKIPLAALEVPRYGSANMHPAFLPRHRGPVPFAWTLREGDSHFGVTWHRMDAELDTGAILAQDSVPVEDTDTTIFEIAPKVMEAAIGLLEGVLAKLVAGDPGTPQDDTQATWAGHFEEDYATVDWSQPARSVHNQVRAWSLTFGMSDLVAPVAELDGERVRLIRTSLTDPGAGARRLDCGDGPIWVLESEPVNDR
jgi:methionyl-tRNA formyltransferase